MKVKELLESYQKDWTIWFGSVSYAGRASKVLEMDINGSFNQEHFLIDLEFAHGKPTIPAERFMKIVNASLKKCGVRISKEVSEKIEDAAKTNVLSLKNKKF